MNDIHQGLVISFLCLAGIVAVLKVLVRVEQQAADVNEPRARATASRGAASDTSDG